jgi:hypothetical protein
MSCDFVSDIWLYGIFPWTSLREMAVLSMVSVELNALCHDFLAHLTLPRLRALVDRLPRPEQEIDNIKKIFKAHETALCYFPMRGIFEGRGREVAWNTIGGYFLEIDLTPVSTWTSNVILASIHRTCFSLNDYQVYTTLDRSIRLAVARIKLKEAEEEYGKQPVLKKQKLY